MIGQGSFSKMLLILLAGTLPFSSEVEENQEPKQKETEEIIINAYIYGYPLVSMDMTRRVMTNVPTPEGLRAPMGQMANQKYFPTASFKGIKAPNVDTLYSGAWIDLSREPYILSLPEVTDRYFLISLLSGWTDVFATLGTRSTGTQSQIFAITGPGWDGILPNGVKELKSPTNLVWINGQIYCTGTSEDYAAVYAIQDKYRLIPLSLLGKPFILYKERVDPAVDMKTPIHDQVDRMSGINFFKSLAHLLKENPPSPNDAQMVEMMTKLGIIAGGQVDNTTIELNVIQATEKAPEFAQERIEVHAEEMGKKVNGWKILSDIGKYDAKYLSRASAAAFFLGANLPDDLLFPFTHEDADGKVLDGANKYVLHFPKGNLPPVKGFWSLTMYDDQLFFVDNPLNRYALSSRNALKYNNDGSLDIYIQNASPGPEKEANWLATPKGNFVLMLRLYSPEKAILDGAWVPPAVEREKKWFL